MAHRTFLYRNEQYDTMRAIQLLMEILDEWDQDEREDVLKACRVHEE